MVALCKLCALSFPHSCHCIGPGSFCVTVRSGLVRLGLCAASADVDNLGTDLKSFGYGGTGKMLRSTVPWDGAVDPFGAGLVLGWWR